MGKIGLKSALFIRSGFRRKLLPEDWKCGYGVVIRVN